MGQAKKFLDSVEELLFDDFIDDEYEYQKYLEQQYEEIVVVKLQKEAEQSAYEEMLNL